LRSTYRPTERRPDVSEFRQTRSPRAGPSQWTRFRAARRDRDQTSHHLGWLTHVVDRTHLAGYNHVTLEDRESLHDLTKTLERISHDARRLATHVRQLEVGGPDLAASPVGDQRASASCSDPSGGL
jgi:hypothetical protein